MFLPIGSYRHSDAIPWMTLVLVSVCIVIYFVQPVSNGKRIGQFCESSNGQRTVEALREAGAQLGKTEDEQCLTTVVLIADGRATALVANSKLSQEEKNETLRLLKRADS